MQLTALVGKKSYQKQAFLQNGKRIPLTGVNIMGNFVTQIKTTEKEGYNAIQIGIDSDKKAGKREKNQATKAGLQHTPRFFKEIKVENLEGITLGAQINAAEVFAPGDTVDITGTSKGKGWAGGVKRWGFHGGPRTHGQSDRERAPGSIGQTTTPGRVYKGKKMAGRMGSETVTIKNLEVIEITADGVLLVKGLIPGSLNSVVVVKKVGENKKFVPLYKEAVEELVAEKASEEVSQLEDNGSSSVSEDASQSNSETQSSETAQLSESQPAISENIPEIKPEAALNSSEDVQAPIVQEITNEKPEEAKEEVKEDAKS